MSPAEMYYGLAPALHLESSEHDVRLVDARGHVVFSREGESVGFFRDVLAELKRQPRAMSVVQKLARRAGEQEQIDRFLADGVIVPTRSLDYFDDAGAFSAVIASPSSPEITFHFRGGQYDLVSGIPPQEFISAVGIARHNLVFLRDLAGGYYQSIAPELPSFDHLVAWQLGVIAGFGRTKRVNCIGSSMGGYAAIRSGAAINADRVIAFSPVESPDDDRPLRERITDSHGAATRYDIWYGADADVDRDVALTFADLPHCHLHPVDTSGHATLLTLWNRGQLPRLFDESSPAAAAAAAADDPEAIGAEIERFIGQRFLGGRSSDIRRDTRLFERGIMDSFDFMVLVAFLDERFGVSLDLNAGEFDSIDELTKLVLASRGAGGPP